MPTNTHVRPCSYHNNCTIPDAVPHLKPKLNSTEISSKRLKANSQTVEIPIAWLRRLIELGKKADVSFYSLIDTQIDMSKLSELKGYIESAEFLLPKKGK